MLLKEVPTIVACTKDKRSIGYIRQWIILQDLNFGFKRIPAKAITISIKAISPPPRLQKSDQELKSGNNAFMSARDIAGSMEWMKVKPKPK